MVTLQGLLLQELQLALFVEPTHYDAEHDEGKQTYHDPDDGPRGQLGGPLR